MQLLALPAVLSTISFKTAKSVLSTICSFRNCQRFKALSAVLGTVSGSRHGFVFKKLYKSQNNLNDFLCFAFYLQEAAIAKVV